MGIQHRCGNCGSCVSLNEYSRYVDRGYCDYCSINDLRTAVGRVKGSCAALTAHRNTLSDRLDEALRLLKHKNAEIREKHPSVCLACGGLTYVKNANGCYCTCSACYRRGEEECSHLWAYHTPTSVRCTICNVLGTVEVKK